MKNADVRLTVLVQVQGSGASISYPDISPQQQALFRGDGDHLSDLGNSIFYQYLDKCNGSFLLSLTFLYQHFLHQYGDYIPMLSLSQVSVLLCLFSGTSCAILISCSIAASFVLVACQFMVPFMLKFAVPFVLITKLV